MTRAAWTAHERSIVAACAIGAVGVAIANPQVWGWFLNLSINSSIDLALWLGTALAVVPTCLALAAAVLTARPPVGTVIAVASGLVAVWSNLQYFDQGGGMLSGRDYFRWAVWAVVVACALLAADATAWRLGRFTVATGALAGVLVALAAALLKVALDAVGTGALGFGSAPAEYWLTVYVVPSVMLVATGALTGSAAARPVAPQEAAGLG